MGQAPEERAAARAPAAAAEPEAPEPPAPAPRALLARLVDESMEPLAGGSMGFYEATPSEPSGADGRLRLPLDPRYVGAGYGTVFRCPGRATFFTHVDITSDPEIDLGDVVLRPGGGVAGRLLDEQGRPVEDALVVVDPPRMGDADHERMRRSGPQLMGWALRTRSGADGTYRLDGIELGSQRIWAGLPGVTRWEWLDGVEVRAGEVEPLPDLVLDPVPVAELIRGLVLDPDGKPLVDQSVRCDRLAGLGGWTRFTRTDDQGRFRIGVVDPGPHILRAQDGKRRWADAVVPRAEPGAAEQVLAFRATRLLTFDVRIGERPAEAFELVARSPDKRFGIAYVDGTGGYAELREPNEPFALRLRAEGASEEAFGPFEPGDLADHTPLRLAAAQGIRGRVVDGDAPVPGARVQLLQLPMARVLIHVNGFPSRVPAWPQHEVETDEEGRFTLTPDEAGDYVVRVERSGYAPSEREFLGLDPVRGHDELELALTGGGSIAGRVRPRAGDDVAGTIVALSRGDAWPRVLRADAEGHFRADRLTPGPWRVEVLAEDPNLGEMSSLHSAYEGGVDPFEPNTQVYEGQLTRHDLDLERLPRCVVRGRFTLNGEPASGWSAELRREIFNGRDADNPTAALDPDGGFELEVANEGPHRLAFRSPGGQEGLAITLALDLTTGTTEVDRDLAVGRLVGEGALSTAAGSTRLYAEWRGEDGAHARLRVRPAADGTFALDPVPAGAIELVRYPKEVWSSGAARTVAEVEVPAGGEGRVQLP
ncbi:MAG: carboxypeptidase-like regulatory domain-containing protein [Planctomycetota bacterium]